MSETPNVLFVFTDQMRGSAMGCAGEPNVRTPELDRFASEAVRFTHAYCNSPLCTPSRGTILTGTYPIRHRAATNDLPVATDLPAMGRLFRDAGYATGYVGKWHLDGVPRDKFTPPGERRLGFDFWAVHECTHNYLNSFYYTDSPEPIPIDGYEPITQTDLAERFIRDNAGRPWCLALSYGPPHYPYRKLPRKYLDMYPPASLELPESVPAGSAEEARRDYSGYLAHITALDEQFSRLMRLLEELDLVEDTLVIFTSDHGDMLHSHGLTGKQQPWEESIRVPLLMRLPGRLSAGNVNDELIALVDVLPTILGLVGLEVPSQVQGMDLSATALGQSPGRQDVLLEDACACDESWLAGRPVWRGLRTGRHTYARTPDGPWVLYDNVSDPGQSHNLLDDPSGEALRVELDELLQRRLGEVGDELLPWDETLRRRGLVELWNTRERAMWRERARVIE
ncbi:MAG: sulfatase family protein [Phycisphaerae bacterium]